MKKFLYSVMAAAALFSTVSCSDDDDNQSGGSSSSVKIGGTTYVIKDNTNIRKYNITARDASAPGRTTQTLMMFSGDDMENLDALSVTVNFANANGISGTYDFAEDAMGDVDAATILYSANDKNWFSVPEKGQVKITGMGNEKYKIEFLDVELDDLVGGPKMTVTGATTKTFYFAEGN